MRRVSTALAGLICIAAVSGCTVAYDRMGEPAGVGFFLAASEQPTDAQRLARIGADVAESAAPFLPAPWGQILTAAGALGLGVVGERRVRKASDSAWDEAKADEAMRRGSA